MSLESVVERLAYAVEQQGNNSAVAEIIRQRDSARAQVASLTSSRDYWIAEDRRRSGVQYKLERKNAALRGVITRMKAKAASNG
jgi:hypothetical protein